MKDIILALCLLFLLLGAVAAYDKGYGTGYKQGYQSAQTEICLAHGWTKKECKQ